MNGYKKGDSILKALIVSDNHGNLEVLEELTYIYKKDIDLWLHCGDSEFIAADPIWNFFKTVKGNMDFDHKLVPYRKERLGNQNLLLVHGHKHQVDNSLEYLNKLAEEQQCDIIFYGHTHIAKVDKFDGKYFINPGSITQPRGELEIGSYAIYEKNKRGDFILFYNKNHQKISHYSMKLTI